MPTWPGPPFCPDVPPFLSHVQDTEIAIDDAIRGRVAWNTNTLGDFVILRSNGQPVYNFCVAVDDALMAISHVIRAEEHLPNSLRQVSAPKPYALRLKPYNLGMLEPALLGLFVKTTDARHWSAHVHVKHSCPEAAAAGRLRALRSVCSAAEPWNPLKLDLWRRL